MFKELFIWKSKSIVISAGLMIALLGIEIRGNADNLLTSQEAKNADQAETNISEDELAKVIAALENPETRMNALARLIRFASYRLHQIPSMNWLVVSKLDELKERAADAVRKQTNFETIDAALDSTDPKLQFWGLLCWRGSPESRESAADEWKSLLPKIKKLAIDGDTNVRDQAIQRLQDFSEYKEFLAERVHVESSPYILSRLAYHPNKAEFSKRLNPLLLRSLDHTDEEVRVQTLAYIATRSHSAPMWQIDFDKAIFDKTFEKTFATSAQERAAAISALTEIRNLDLNLSLEAIIRLTEDESDEVRSRAAWGLKDQFQHQSVIEPVIAKLLKDPSPLVQYMTILAVGPEKFLKDLKRLSQVSDRKVAEWASAKLKQLSENEKSK